MPTYRFLLESGRKLSGGKPDAAALQAELRRLHLPGDGLSIGIRGDTVRLAGQVPDAEARERVVLAVGNVRGVARVEDRLETVEQPPVLGAILGSFAHLPRGAAGSDAAEEAVHDARPAPAHGPAGSLFVAAAPDDSLPSLARRHYGDEYKWPRILEANRDALGPEQALTPGLTLRLPQP
jgi:nucleoid-associated protein YgaU